MHASADVDPTAALIVSVPPDGGGVLCIIRCDHCAQFLVGGVVHDRALFLMAGLANVHEKESTTVSD